MAMIISQFLGLPWLSLARVTFSAVGDPTVCLAQNQEERRWERRGWRPEKGR
jgi:hypothetical protein